MVIVGQIEPKRKDDRTQMEKQDKCTYIIEFGIGKVATKLPKIELDFDEVIGIETFGEFVGMLRWTGKCEVCHQSVIHSHPPAAGQCVSILMSAYLSNRA